MKKYINAMSRFCLNRPLGLVFIRVAVGLALAGSGRYSAWKMECDDCGGMLCDSAECTRA